MILPVRSEVMEQTKIEARDRLIVALDVPTATEALDLVAALDGCVSFFKVGLQLFVSDGLLSKASRLIQQLSNAGKKVFLDLKMDDVEETIRLTLAGIAQADDSIRFVTIHGTGATAKAARDGRGNSEYPKLLFVTLLSSLDQHDLHDLFMGQTIPLDTYVKFRAKQALDAGCDGLIASGRSVEMLRKEYPKTTIVTPGIRPPGSSTDEHKRSLTPREAIVAGSDYLVVGRPIRNAANPKNMAERIISEIEMELRERSR